MLKLNVRHSLLKTQFLEIRFAPESTIEEVKDKLHRMTGTPPHFQELVLIKSNSQQILGPDRATLGDFFAETGDEISLTDRNPHSLFGPAFQEAKKNYVAPVADEAKYLQLEGSVYQQIEWKLKNDKAFRDHYYAKIKERQDVQMKEFELAAKTKVGDRCQIVGKRRGTIKFIGDIKDKGQGIYVGIQLDEPLGDCEGDGFFECPRKFGTFFNISEVEIGDFPELAFDDESDSEL
ncbi:Tubulin_specific chaperone B [Hexamita inflata]|uniref:Tubulin specific chaperone B n=1 Tax=Hexamita inflata TaxID=28002 RepID=A0AA86U5J5_9EUKA|nr:Tubulin specific chaperone B [Hexamita inflata]